MMNFLKFVKNRIFKISQFQNSTFVRTTENKIQKKLGITPIQKIFEGVVAF